MPQPMAPDDLVVLPELLPAAWPLGHAGEEGLSVPVHEVPRDAVQTALRVPHLLAATAEMWSWPLSLLGATYVQPPTSHY